MLKYIGAGVTMIGILLLLLVIYTGRKKEISKAAEELHMITDAGYASEHVAVKKERAQLEGTLPQKKKKRRRDLSEESRSILELVEKERAEKEEQRTEKAPDDNAGKGTAVLGEEGPRQGTAILESASPQSRSTDVLPEKGKKTGTAVLQEDITYTDILRPVKGTAVLEERALQQDLVRGTAVLQEETPKDKGFKQATDVLPQTKSGTDVLPERKGTAVLQEANDISKGTDVLPEREKRNGTAVLQ